MGFSIVCHDDCTNPDSYKGNCFICATNVDTVIKYTTEQMIPIVTVYHYKDKFVQHMADLNMSEYVPNTYNTKPSKYPCFAKPIEGVAGSGVVFIKDVEQYKKFVLRRKSEKSQYIVQKFISDKNYNVCHVLCVNGKIIKSIVYSTVLPHDNTIVYGAIKNYKSRDMNDLEQHVFSTILDKDKYHGMACIDYKLTKTGLKIFEINPRIGGSLVDNFDDFIQFVQCYFSTIKLNLEEPINTTKTAY
jgi:predicted ATP-grasp superfamily ATP-dependent carboligase